MDVRQKSLPFAAGRREGGVLLHVTSLPGPFGIGDLGPTAYEWIDHLSEARVQWWQILPLNPTAEGNSPYQSPSAFAGNPLLISPELLIADKLLAPDEMPALRCRSRVDFASARRSKERLLKSAFEEFRRGGDSSLRAKFNRFCEDNIWLTDFARFMAFAQRMPGKRWTDWPRGIRDRDANALSKIDSEFRDAIEFHRFVQFIFFRQLAALRQHAHKRGVGLLGDVPIFVAHHSADVWANRQLFQLNRNGRPIAVAGVPPDAFAADGQCWNNPLYDWAAMAEEDYAWWTARMAAALTQTDAARLDHFRGFEAYWRIPAGKLATAGRWVAGPGGALFERLTARLGSLPVIAEDLGVITPAVERLRDEFNLPGMRVLQFGFGGLTDSIHLPHRVVQASVVYTGTHDNDTTAGWFKTLNEHEKARLVRYAGSADARRDPAWAMIRMAWASTAGLAIIPAQDLMNLPSKARMNTPGTTEGNWEWRLRSLKAVEAGLSRLSELSVTYARA